MDLVATVNPYRFSYSKVALIVGIFGALIFLLILLHRTRLGRQMRAVSDNPDLAASSGIHVERVHASTAFLSSGIAGLGGALLAAILPVNPNLGLALLLPAFAVIVLGTIGSVSGVIIGALIVGLLRAVSEPVLIGAGNALDRPTASGFAEVMPFVFLVGLLLLAPRGIGSAIQNWNIERIRKRRSAQQSTGYSLSKGVFAPVSHLAAIMTAVTPYVDRVNERKDEVIEWFGKAIAATWSLPASYMAQLSTALKSTITAIPSFLSGPRIKPSNWMRIDRETERGSWITFVILFLVLVGIVWFLPSVTSLTKTMQVARIITLVGIFGLAAFSLNLHTGITGMTNFGVIFFIGIGAVIVGLLSTPVATNGYGWNPWTAT
ncbi:MAG: hypothetical protein QGG54_19425, partial [Gammaproteobacteria bacterium]|nr:hypothetical protein [Gammaproteobacteria bacterium]